MALVVVCASLGYARQHRQDRLGAVERLDLALLIDTKHTSTSDSEYPSGASPWIALDPLQLRSHIPET